MKTIVFDFDGVIHKYREGWRDGSIYDEPNPIIVNTIKKIMAENKYAIAIVSTRDPVQIHQWIQENKLFPSRVMDDNEKFLYSCAEVGITNRKIPAVLYVDDRGFRYNPNMVSKPDFCGLDISNPNDLVTVLYAYAEM